MQVKIERPFSAENPVGCFENHYGVKFIVVETDPRFSKLVADIPDEEAEAMIEAGRVVADIPDEEAEVKKTRKSRSE